LSLAKDGQRCKYVRRCRVSEKSFPSTVTLPPSPAGGGSRVSTADQGQSRCPPRCRHRYKIGSYKHRLCHLTSVVRRYFEGPRAPSKTRRTQQVDARYYRHFPTAGGTCSAFPRRKPIPMWEFHDARHHRPHNPAKPVFPRQRGFPREGPRPFLKHPSPPGLTPSTSLVQRVEKNFVNDPAGPFRNRTPKAGLAANPTLPLRKTIFFQFDYQGLRPGIWRRAG